MKRFYETYVEHFPSTPAQTVLEIGSRDGDDAEALRVLGLINAWDVFIVEPHPESFRHIIHKYPYANTYCLAVSDKPGVVDFNAIPASYSAGEVGTSSLLKRNKTITITQPDQLFPERWVKVLAVTGTTILELADKPEIDLVKIDVEGSTFEVLESFGDNIRLLKALHLEVEIPPLTLWEGQKHYKEIQDLMTWYGFEEKYYEGKYWNLIAEPTTFLQGDSIWVRNG